MLGFDLENLILIRPAVDIFDPKIIRASMGAIFKIQFNYFDSFLEYKNQFPSQNFYPFMTNAKFNLRDIKFQKPTSLIFGSESAGLSDDFSNIGTSVKIPQNENIDSFNLAISVGLGLYEFTKK